MAQAKQIEREYKLSNAFMLQEAQVRKDLFDGDKAAFLVFDAGTFNDPFSANMQTKINTAGATLSDDAIRDQMKELTDQVLASMDTCRTYFQNGKYFVEKAFPGNKAVHDEFGAENYLKVRLRQDELISFMENLCVIINKYRPQLLAAGATAAMLDQAVVLRDDLKAKNRAQEIFKSGREVLTRDRTIKYNAVWSDVYKICKAGKIIFQTDYVKFHQYLLPASEEHIKFLIKGKITDSVTGNAIAHAEINIVELTLDVNSDEKGKYGFAAIAEAMYTLQFQKIGYTPQTINNVEVIAGKTKVLDVIMIPAIP